MTAAKKKAVTKSVARHGVPMSESAIPKITDRWTADQCIAELRRVAEIDVEKVVSRNYFRVHGRIAESVWNEHFGTFHEFKRQANIVLTRQQHKLERDIAKHASVDHYRQLGAEREAWGDKYIRPGKGRFKTIIFASDLHDIEIDPFFLRVFLDTVRRVQPEVVSLVGDVFDLPEFGKYGVDPREWDVVGRIKFAHDKIFKGVRDVFGGQLDLVEGNHEFRLLRHFADATPALRAVLADLHGMSIPKLLGLDEFEVNYVAQGDLGAYTERDIKNELNGNFRIYYDAIVAHHFPHGRNMGLPGVNGHHHSHQSWPGFSPVYGAFEWHQMGCGHRRSASYTEGQKWHMGFDIVSLDTVTRTTVHDYVTVNDFAVSGGKFYTRTKSEEITKPLLRMA